MSAAEACGAAAEAIVRIKNDAEVVCLPMSDGGEGLVHCLQEVLALTPVTCLVHNPLMKPIMASYAMSADGSTAYMEMAAAAGLTLLEPEERDPIHATTFGVGEMMLDAVRRGCKHIVMGIGGSATCDAGKGMVECLRNDLPLPVTITVACDVQNPLYGPQGAAYVFAPQKGATGEQIPLLDYQLRSFARNTEAMGIADPTLAMAPGSGAAGGLGYALMAYMNAELRSGIDLVLDAVQFDTKLQGATLVVTGEGKSDRQTLMGKVPMGVLDRCRRKNIPVWLLSGGIEESEELLHAGFSKVLSINKKDSRPLHELMQKGVAIQNLKQTVIASVSSYHP